MLYYTRVNKRQEWSERVDWRIKKAARWACLAKLIPMQIEIGRQVAPPVGLLHNQLLGCEFMNNLDNESTEGEQDLDNYTKLDEEEEDDEEFM